MENILMPTIDELLTNLAKILLVLGVVFIFTKIAGKRGGYNPNSFHNRNKNILYQLHVNGSKIGVILAFSHGFINSPKGQTTLLTGCLLGVIMLALLGLGAYLSIKQKSKPMTEQEDDRWKTHRLVKWILTPLLFLAIGIHYFL